VWHRRIGCVEAVADARNTDTERAVKGLTRGEKERAVVHMTVSAARSDECTGINLRNKPTSLKTLAVHVVSPKEDHR
jgi:hypothetical protein